MGGTRSHDILISTGKDHVRVFKRTFTLALSSVTSQSTVLCRLVQIQRPLADSQCLRTAMSREVRFEAQERGLT